MRKEILHLKIAELPVTSIYDFFSYNTDYWDFSFDPHFQYEFNNDFALGPYDYLFWISTNGLLFFEVLHPTRDMDIVFIEYDFSELIE